jgi:hypothetical protein
MARQRRKLEILPDDQALERLNYLTQPAVLWASIEELDETRSTLIYGMMLEQASDDGKYDLTLYMVDGSGSTYRLESRDEIDIDRESGKVRFSAYGNKYTIRAIEDTDSSWILEDQGAKATAEELEQMAAENAANQMEIL